MIVIKTSPGHAIASCDGSLPISALYNVCTTPKETSTSAIKTLL